MSQPLSSPSPPPSAPPDPPAPSLPSSPTASTTTTNAATPTSESANARTQPLPTDLTFDDAVARANEPVPRLAVANATESQTAAVFTRLFPFLNEPRQSLPIHGVCQVIPTTGELVSACPLPSADVWKQYTKCMQTVCNVAGVNGGAIEANEACAIARQDECAWIAATASVCVPLSLQPLRDAQVYLPRLPRSRSSQDTNFRRLLAAHHASVGVVNSPLMTDVRVTNPVAFLDPNAELGVCLPTLPVGTKCDPQNDPTTAAPSGFPSPWLVPLPRLEGYSLPPEAVTSERGQPQFQKSVALYSPGRPLFNLTRHALVANDLTARRVLQPPVILLNVPTTETNATVRSSSTTPLPSSRTLFESSNVYSLVYCQSASREYRAKHLPESSSPSRPCASNLDCLFNAACNPSTRRCGSINSSGVRPGTQYLGNDQIAAADNDTSPATRDLSSLTVQLVVLGIFILMMLVRQFRKRIFAFWARVNHKFKGASTTAQRELTLQPASNDMLDDLNDGRRRRRASLQGQQEVDAELGVLTVGDALPRYHVGMTLGRGTVQRSDTADTLTLPPAFSTTDRFAGIGTQTAEERDASRANMDAVDEEVDLQAASETEAVEAPANVETDGSGSQATARAFEAEAERHEDETGPEHIDERRALSPSTVRE